ncbi:MAG: hypothetical protein LUD81_02095 [Clostridiales bacterium]|nr:hypothetical protein [Clostridiales bacterium]
MKKILSLLIALAMVFQSFGVLSYAENEYEIILTVGTTELEATLYDNSTTRELISRLPLTLPMMDLYCREMCYRFADELPTDDVQDSSYEVGEIVYWPPGHSFVIMYTQNGEVFEMQKLGYVDSGVEIFETTGDIEVKIELADSKTETEEATGTEEFKENTGAVENEEFVENSNLSDDTGNKIIMTADSETVNIFGEESTVDTPPIIVNDRIMLPARFVFEQLGAAVEWDAADKKAIVSKGEVTIEIYIDSDTAYVNGEAAALDSPAFISNGRTYLPLRFISEAIGADIEWKPETKQVIITI